MSTKSVFFKYQLGLQKLSVIRSSVVSAFQALYLSIEVNGRTVGTFRIVRYISSSHVLLHSKKL